MSNFKVFSRNSNILYVLKDKSTVIKPFLVF